MRAVEEERYLHPVLRPLSLRIKNAVEVAS
jgi:hypothetical protein